MADPLLLCDGGGILNGGVSVINAVSIFVTFSNNTLCTLSPRTSAGLYYFSAKLAPPKYSGLASWITGRPSLHHFLLPSHELVSRMGQYHGPNYSRVFH
jgi:hypothetical protein